MRLWASATSMLWSGIGSGGGEPGLSHSSVHAVRSMRAGLPVSERERMVSREVAATYFCFTTGCVSASSVVSHTEPHHTPAAPSASAAATWRPRAMPPAARTGVGATASTTSGTSTMVAISPVCPPASVPWAMTMSAPAAWWRTAWTTVPASAATGTPAARQRSTTGAGGAPRALANSPMRWANATSSSGS